jgi:excisionase family DNA binding protein
VEELLTVEEVAKWLKVHRATVYRLIDAGTLTPVKFGGIVRFRASDLEAMIAKPPAHQADGASGDQGSPKRRAARPRAVEPAPPDDPHSGER